MDLYIEDSLPIERAERWKASYDKSLNTPQLNEYERVYLKAVPQNKNTLSLLGVGRQTRPLLIRSKTKEIKFRNDKGTKISANSRIPMRYWLRKYSYIDLWSSETHSIPRCVSDKEL